MLDKKTIELKINKVRQEKKVLKNQLRNLNMKIKELKKILKR